MPASAAAAGRHRDGPARPLSGSFFMPQPEPAQPHMDRRQAHPNAALPAQLGLDLGQRDIRLRRHQRPQHVLVRRQHRPAVAAIAGRRHAPRRAHPRHQLDRRGRADGKARRRAPHRTPTLNGFNNALAQIPRQRCRHDEPPTHQRPTP